MEDNGAKMEDKAQEECCSEPGPIRIAVANVIHGFGDVVGSLRIGFLAGLAFLAWLVGSIGTQVDKAVAATAAEKAIEAITAIGVGGLYLLIAGGVLGLMGSLIAGPNPLAVIAGKLIDKIKA